MGQLRSVAPVLLVFGTLFLTNAATGDPTAPESPSSEITEVPRSLTLAETGASGWQQLRPEAAPAAVRGTGG